VTLEGPDAGAEPQHQLFACRERTDTGKGY
jgi:hypothetical protein